MEVAATGAAAEAIGRHVPQLVADRVASRLFDRDATLWGPDAEPEAGVRLGWVGLHRSSRPLLGQIAALRDELLEQGLDHVVLCGMGGSSLAPEVICAAAGVELTVLDSSEPGQVAAALGDRLERTVVVVSSKSGSTVETDSQRRAYVAAFEDAGLDPTRHLVVVTDPGSPLDEQSRADGYRVVNADPNVGGRYSALTAFGLVPSGLAGADVEELLDDAEAVADLLAEDDEGNPALRLAAAMAGTDPLRDKLVLVEEESGLPGFPDWAEQLIAESTGKDGTGVLPVVVGSTADPEVALPPPDATVVRLGGDTDSDTGSDADADPGSDPDAGTEPNTEPDSGAAGGVAGDRSGAAGEGGPATATSPVVTATAAGSEVAVSGSLGAQLLLWETATAVAGRLLGINPFDQPDVESAKKAARSLLEGSPDEAEPEAVDGPLEIRTLGPGWAGEVASLADAVDALLSQVDPDRGYLAVMAYLDRIVHADLADVRRTLAIRTRRPVTFGWGPRFLHSTGQFHKGGPAVGVFLQVTAEPVRDLSVPGRDFTFGRLVAAQAAGDARVLAEHGRPVLRLHLRDVAGGLEMLRKALA